MKRSEYMRPAKVQVVPRGKWRSGLYADRGDGAAEVLIGAKEYVVPLDQVRRKDDPSCS